MQPLRKLEQPRPSRSDHTSQYKQPLHNPYKNSHTYQFQVPIATQTTSLQPIAARPLPVSPDDAAVPS